jgi:hypothetical protein
MDFQTQFLLFIILVFVGSFFFIRFLMKYQEKSYRENLKITSSDAWKIIQIRSNEIHLSRENLIYGIYQDENVTTASMLLRNSKDEEVGKSLYPMAKRKKEMFVSGEKYIITHVLSWRGKAILQKENDESILATRINLRFGKHKFDIPDYGTLESSLASWSFKVGYKYMLHKRPVGLIDFTFDGYKKGRIAVLPQDIPLEVRCFMISVSG